MAIFLYHILANAMMNTVIGGDEIKISNMLSAVKIFMQQCLNTKPEVLEDLDYLF